MQFKPKIILRLGENEFFPDSVGSIRGYSHGSHFDFFQSLCIYFERGPFSAWSALLRKSALRAAACFKGGTAFV